MKSVPSAFNHSSLITHHSSLIPIHLQLGIWLPAQTSLYRYRLDAKKLLASKPFARAKLAARTGSGDEVVGWMDDQPSKSARFQDRSGLFLSPEERNQFRTIPGKVIPLIKAAAEWQVQQGLSRGTRVLAKIIFQLEADNQTMLKFTARYLPVVILNRYG